MSRLTIVEGNSNDKDNVRAIMVKGEKGEMGDLNHNDIIDNLTSTATDKVLSANQGKQLKDLIDDQEELINKKTYYFNNVVEMKNQELKVGDYVITKGYYEANDGGAGEYEIVNDDTLTDDAGSVIGLNNGLKAVLIINNNTISVKQFGAKGDGETDDLTAFNNAISYISGKYMNLHINAGNYLLSEALTINWQNGNFNQVFNGSYSIKGDGIFETKLIFTSSNGLLINPNSNMLSIDISDFSVENEDFDVLQQTGNERTPTDTTGIGLLVRHIGYTGHVSRIGVRGFYIGIASRNNYGGPIFDSLFTNNCIFGFSSKNDTTIQINSSSFKGLESCYIQENGVSTIVNTTCENMVNYFLTNTYNQRSKFEGRGFSFLNCRSTLIACYNEHLYGNARYVKDSVIEDINGDTNNNMNYNLENNNDYADLKSWLDNNIHNYDDYYVDIVDVNNSVKVERPYLVGTATVYVNVVNGSNVSYSESNNVQFNYVRVTGTFANNFNRFYKGPTKPIVILASNVQTYNKNLDLMPYETYGVPKYVNNKKTTNFNGDDSINLARKSSSFTDTSYNEVQLYMRHALDGSIRFYKQTLLDDTTVSNTEVIRIASDGKVTFPQN